MRKRGIVKPLILALGLLATGGLSLSLTPLTRALPVAAIGTASPVPAANLPWVNPAVAQMCFSNPEPHPMPDGGEAGTAGAMVLWTVAAPEYGAFLFRSGHAGWDGRGSLQKFAAPPDVAGQRQIGSPIWDAGLILNGDPASSAAEPPQPPASLRKIYTLRRNLDQSTSTIAFSCG